MEKQLDSSGFKTPEEEIAYLKQEIRNKEQELKEQNIESNKDQIVREEINKYRNTLAQDVISPTLQIQNETLESMALDLKPEEHDTKIDELLKVMNEKGIKNTFSLLQKMHDPHLDDDFHRFLVQYLKHGHSAKGVSLNIEEFKGLDMTLFEVVLPEDNDNQNNKSLKEIISGMEQFLSGMLSVVTADQKKYNEKNYIVLEIANANGSDKVIFYVAVPRAHKDLFEKQTTSIFHNAVITEITEDYNIFNTEGHSLGSYLESTNTPLYEFKTYDSFDHDPMNVLLNSFSKIDKQDQGASIQIVFAPKGEYFINNYKYSIEQIEKGVPTKEAIHIPTSVTGEFGKAFKSFFTTPPKVEENKPVDAEAIEKIKKKISSTIVATNIRLISSAKTKVEAEKILQSLESSFNQFTNPAGNGLKPKRLEGDKLSSMLRSYSYRNYNESELVPLNLREITTLIHFHNSKLSRTPQLKQSLATLAPAPDDIGEGGVFLGINTYRNTETKIFIDEIDRLRHTYTIGQTGTGKTTLLTNMIIQDIQLGNGCCYIDPHGTDVQNILSSIPKERFKDVIYFDPSHVERPMALNMLEYDKNRPEQKTFVVNELFSIFQKLYGAVPEALGPMFEQYFRNATMLVIEDPESGSTLLDVSRVMTNKAFRELKLSKCKNPIVVQFWREVAEKAGGEASLANIVPYITSKFDVFLANDIMRPIVAQEKSSFDFRKIMDEKKILLVNLSKGKLGEINSSLIGLILVGKILMAALSRVDMVSGQNFPAFYLYMDEFQNVTTNSISTILSEARKYKLSINVAHQFIAQLDQKIKDSVFGNVGSIFSFRVGSEDAEFLEKQYSPVFTAKDLMNIDNYNFYAKMLVNGKTAKAFNVKEEAPVKGNIQVAENLKQLSFLTYGGDREEIEKKILEKYQK